MTFVFHAHCRHASFKEKAISNHIHVCLFFNSFTFPLFKLDLMNKKKNRTKHKKNWNQPHPEQVHSIGVHDHGGGSKWHEMRLCEWKSHHTLWGNPTTAWTTTSAILPREDWKFLWRHFNSISSIVLEPIANQYLSNVGWGVYQWDQTGPEQARERRRRRLFELEETKEPQKMTETSRTSWITCFSKIHGRQECFQN